MSALLAMSPLQSVITAAVIVALMAIVGIAGTRRLQRVPAGLQNFLELLVDGMRSLTVGIIGPHGARFTPYVGTVFVYILIMNLMSLLPPALHLVPPTTRFDTTLALGLATYVFVIIVALKENGPIKFVQHMANWIPVNKGWQAVIQLVLLSPLMLFIHAVSECVRPLTLGFRLFMNMFGKESLVVGMLEQGPFGYAIYVAILIPLALIVSIVQTTIFTMLTCVYLSLWTTHEEEHAEHAHEESHS
jgi:F-type H+-transporting ATPase subunit a